MRKMLESFGDQVVEGWELGQKITISKKHNRINVIGMGGSALPGEFLSSYFPDLPVYIHRDYGYARRFSDGLNVCISYSGNTEETIDAFESIINSGHPCIVISSGGKLIDLAKNNNIPYAQVRDDLVPRLALPLLSSVLLSVCAKLGAVNISDSEIRYVAGKLDSDDARAKAQRISQELHKRVPLFYSSSRNKVVALVGKIAMNENAKTQAFCNVFPELNHNEMNGFEVLNGDFAVVFIYDSEDHERNIKRMQLTEQILSNKSVKTLRIDMSSGPRVYKLFTAIQELFWLSTLLAESYSVDAVNVPVVEEFKKQL